MNRHRKRNNGAAAIGETPQLMFAVGWFLAAMVALTIAAHVG